MAHDLNCNCAKSNIPPVVTAFEINLRDRLVGARAGGPHILAECGHRQDTAAACQNRSILLPSAGVENVNVLALAKSSKPSIGFPRSYLSG